MVRLSKHIYVDKMFNDRRVIPLKIENVDQKTIFANMKHLDQTPYRASEKSSSETGRFQTIEKADFNTESKKTPLTDVGAKPEDNSPLSDIQTSLYNIVTSFMMLSYVLMWGVGSALAPFDLIKHTGALSQCNDEDARKYKIGYIILSSCMMMPLLNFNIFLTLKALLGITTVINILNNIRLPRSETALECLSSIPRHFEQGHQITYDFDINEELPVGLWNYHPHGIMTWSGLSMLAHMLKKYNHIPAMRVQCLGSSMIITAPLVKSWNELIGSPFRCADKNTLSEMMDENIPVFHTPGGYHEATISNQNSHRVYLKNRKGFVKMALRKGYALYPIYTFGENDTYYNPQYYMENRLKMNDSLIPGTLPMFGDDYCFLLPKKEACLHTFVGKPVLLPKIENPTKEDLDKYHSMYIEHLEHTFNKFKSEVDKDAKLEIW